MLDFFQLELWCSGQLTLILCPSHQIWATHSKVAFLSSQSPSNFDCFSITGPAYRKISSLLLDSLLVPKTVGPQGRAAISKVLYKTSYTADYSFWAYTTEHACIQEGFSGLKGYNYLSGGWNPSVTFGFLWEVQSGLWYPFTHTNSKYNPGNRILSNTTLSHYSYYSKRKNVVCRATDDTCISCSILACSPKCKPKHTFLIYTKILPRDSTRNLKNRSVIKNIQQQTFSFLP